MNYTLTWDTGFSTRTADWKQKTSYNLMAVTGYLKLFNNPSELVLSL
jgi:hypothetical protein